MRTLPIIAVALLVVSSASRAENWPAWRGPLGDGVSQDTGLSVVWNKAHGIVWTTPLPEWGDSTPAIWDNAIFVTSNTGDKLLLLKLNKQDGAIEWTQEVGSGEVGRMPLRLKDANERTQQKFHELHNLASPSPSTNGKIVVVHFGNGDLAAYDFAGKQLWKRNLQDDHGTYTIWWGHANSPVIVGDLVISACMQDSLADLQPDKPSLSYLVAHDLETGEQRWKTERITAAKAEECDSYTTPVLAEINGKQQLIVMGGNQIDAYDPHDGKQLWFLSGLVGNRTITGPVVAHGHVYATRGQRGALFAVKLDTLTNSSAKRDFHDLAWKYDQGTPDSPSPVVWGDLLFTVTDDGIARAFDALGGQLKWKQRLKGDYKASPIAAEGRVYFLSTSGVCTVVAANDRFEKLAENEIDDSFLASPAVADGRIFLRGRKALYCIGK